MPFPSLKRFFLSVFLLAGLAFFFASGANDVLTLDFMAQHYTSIKGFVSDNQWLSYLGFFCAYTIAVTFSLPIASLLTLVGGAILEWPALVLVVLAATAGASMVFLAAQNVFADILRGQAGTFLGRLEDGFLKDPFFYLLSLRLIPVAPFWVVNIVPAFTSMPFRQFLTATFLGIIPGTCIYIWIGRSFDHLLAAGKTPDLAILTSPHVLLPLAGLGVLTLTPIVARWKKSNLKAKSGKKDKSRKSWKNETN